jgi:phosphoenolpyruvate phosphomutase
MDNEIAIIVDADFEKTGENRDLVSASRPYSKYLYGKSVDLVSISNKEGMGNIHGEFIGLWKVTDKGAAVIKSALEELINDENSNDLTLGDLFNHVLTFHPIAISYIKGSWLDLEAYEKNQKAGDQE